MAAVQVVNCTAPVRDAGQALARAARAGLKNRTAGTLHNTAWAGNRKTGSRDKAHITAGNWAAGKTVRAVATACVTVPA